MKIKSSCNNSVRDINRPKITIKKSTNYFKKSNKIREITCKIVITRTLFLSTKKFPACEHYVLSITL